MEIVSIGRYELLIEVLNGLAMLTSDSGPAGYGGMVALGLIIGVVLTLARGIVTQKLELQWILLGWLLYAALFVPKTTVTVRDIYTGATNVVDNVPIGPAFIGSVTSSVGVGLADAFGNVFAYPSLTRTGYLDTLDLINSFNKIDYGDANDGILGNGGNQSGVSATTDVQRSLNNYLTDCTLYSMTMNLPNTTSWAKLREDPNLLTAIRADSNTWFTTMYLTEGTPNGVVVACSQAYPALVNYMTQTFLPRWQIEIGRKLQLDDPGARIQDALDAVFNVGRDRQIFMLNALIKKQLEMSELGYQAQANNTAGLIMRTQAMEQRRVQWASEQSLFQEMARPLMAYIEAFFYAVSPITAFTFLLGAAGVALFGRYLLLAIWIQLWMPIMAISNLYISMAATSRIQSIAAGGSDPLSMTGLDNVWTVTQSWLATGGMMAAATPLLALMLITGSYYAFTTLTNRMAAADHVNEKIQAPDIMAPAAFANVGAMGLQQPRFTNDPFNQTYMTGALDLLPHINVSRGVSSVAQSKESYAEEVSRNFLQNAVAGSSLARTQDTAGFIQSYVNNQVSSRDSFTDQVLESTGRSVMNDNQRYDAMTKEQRAAFDGAVSLGLMGMGSGGKIGTLLQQVDNKSEGTRKSWAEKIEKLGSHGQSNAVDFTKAIASDQQRGVRGQFVSALGVRDEQAWSEATTTALKAIRGYDEFDSLTQVRGVQQDINTLTIARTAQRGGWLEDLSALATKHGLNIGRIEDEAGAYLYSEQAKLFDMDRTTANGIKLAQALGEGSSEMQADLAKLLNDKGFFTVNANTGDPLRNSGIKSRAESLPDAGSVRDSVQSHLSNEYMDPVTLRGSIDGQLGTYGTPGSRELWNQNKASVQAAFDQGMKENQEANDKLEKKLDDIAKVDKAASIESGWESERSVLGAVSDKNLWEGFKANSGIETFSNSVGTGWRQLRSTTDETMARTNDPFEAALEGLGAGFSGLFNGAVNLPQDRYQRAYDEAKSLGLPDDASSYFARHYQADLGDHIDRAALEYGADPAYNQLKAQVTTQYGELTAQHLERAATSDPQDRARYLQDALGLIEAKQVPPSDHAQPLPMQK